MKIFRLGAKLQLFVYNNGITFKISKLIVGHIQRLVLGRKVTLRTFCTYDHHLRTLFMERRPDREKGLGMVGGFITTGYHESLVEGEGGRV